MGREQKKGRAGNARAYITRARALKKLQLSLPQWRRLCILKGVYPRDPRRKVDGADKTYYLRKDVDFLAHEPLIGTLRAQAIHRRKFVKAKAKKQLDVLRALVLRRPVANLEHVVAERFPRFGDALRELDDPLCVVALFGTLPAVKELGIAAHRVENCRRLINEFLNFVVRTHALRRVFVSVKGYYYQAEIDGELVTWVAPHRFTQALPSDVDYTVMLTFLELYECVLNFVNFRLFTRENLAYPPKIDHRVDAEGRELAAVVMNKKGKDAPTLQEPTKKALLSASAIDAALASVAAGGATKEDEEEDMDDDDESENGNEKADAAVGDMDTDEKEDGAKEDGGEDVPAADGEDGDIDEEGDDFERPLLFAKKRVVLGRETPTVELEFVLRSAGVERVYHQKDVDADPTILETATHWVMDRPTVAGQRVMSIEYVQPQFVFDSLNAGMLLPPSLYGPGAKLPPHLSPFVGDEEDGGYRPWFKDVIDRLKAGNDTVMTEAAVSAYTKESAETAKRRAAKPSSKAVAKKDDDAAAAGANGDADAEDGAVRSGEDSDSGDEEEVDSQGEDSSEGSEAESEDEDPEAEAEAEAEAEREKELKLMMLSRKKSKQYAKFAKEEKLSKQRKASLVEKRNRGSEAASHAKSLKKPRRS